MENNCNIMTDLMPLCAEGLASEDSVRLVEAHTERCESCRSAYAEMKAAAEAQNEENADAAAPLTLVRKKLRRRRARIAALCALGVFVAMTCVLSFLLARQYVPYSPDAVTVTEDENGVLTVSMLGAVDYEKTYCWTSDMPAEGEKPDCIELSMWTNRWTKLTAGGSGILIAFAEPGDGIRAVDYCDYANDGELIRIYGEEREGGAVVLERLVLGVYFVFAMFGALLLGLLWLIFRKKKAGSVFGTLFFAPVAYIAAHFLVTFGNAATYSAGETFLFILAAAAGLFAMTVIAGKLRAERE